MVKMEMDSPDGMNPGMENRERLRRLIGQTTFEFFPSKNPEKGEKLVTGLKLLLPNKSVIAITKHFDRTPEETIAFAKSLKEANPNWTITPHVAARALTSETQALQIAEAIKGISNRAFVIGGDDKEKKGPFASAIELMTFLAEQGVFLIVTA
ncbi:hypothetical protein HY029_04490 [Candidatus Gottesmanbacteria bacterium]|nr:hypothetical protein [Candidatus Gottesmanbacteria bacterium]